MCRATTWFCTWYDVFLFPPPWLCGYNMIPMIAANGAVISEVNHDTHTVVEQELKIVE